MIQPPSYSFQSEILFSVCAPVCLPHAETFSGLLYAPWEKGKGASVYSPSSWNTLQNDLKLKELIPLTALNQK